MMDVRPVTLEGRVVTLQPMTADHIGGLWKAGSDPNLWTLTLTVIRSLEEMEKYVEVALREQSEGRSLPFVICDRKSGTIVGSTRYGNIERTHRRVEIGWTWLDPAYQRTAFNTEAKYLLLTHAFEGLGCIRVEFKTDV